MSIIALVAYDRTPARGLALLGKGLEAKGHVVRHHTPLLSPTNRNVKNDVADADVVIAGLSRTPELSEIERASVRAAIEADTPVVLYADTFGVYGRPWFSFAREHAAVVFVQSREDQDDASRLFPHARVVLSGSPTWEESFFLPFVRENVRSKLKVESHEKMIMLPTSKEVPEIGVHIAAAVEALRVLDNPALTAFVIKNPNDSNDVCAYKRWEEYLPLRVVNNDEFTTQEALCGADLVVTGGSMTGIEAACLRIPTIDILSEVFLARWEIITGSRTWVPADLGISKALWWKDTEGLSDAITELLAFEGYAPYLKAQERVFPAPAREGVAVKKMADAIEELLKAPVGT